MNVSQYCIRFRLSWSPQDQLFIKVYVNKREWVTRVSAKTASKFPSIVKAQAIIDKFELTKHHSTVKIYETNETGSWTREAYCLPIDAKPY